MGRVLLEGVPPLPGSPLALAVVHLDAGTRHDLGDDERDSLVYVFAGGGSFRTDAETEVFPGTAGLVLAGEQAELSAGTEGVSAIIATAGPDGDRHAPLGARETVARLDAAGRAAATGSRSFEVLFGPHNGSTRATLFVGYVPPGRAPWHYHLYDEIVWVPEGPGRLHLGDETEALGPGAAFRLRPREVHIVENTSTDQELAIVGVFTPAGSPSAAYLDPNVAAEHRFSV